MSKRIEIWQTDREILQELVSRIKTRRLKINLSQKELAQETSLSLKTISNIESGKNTSLESFIAILRYFGELDSLNKLFDTKDISPEELYKSKNTPQKQRARKKKND